MRNFILCITFMLFCYCTHAQTPIDTTKVPFVAYWSIGDSYDFRVTQVKKSWKNGIETKNDSSQYIANFTVLDSTSDSYKLKWTYTEQLINTMRGRLEKHLGGVAAIDSILSENNVTTIIYTTDEFGEFVGIENWKEISDLTTEVFSQFMTTLEKKNIKNFDKLKEILNPLIKIYSSKEGVEQLVMNELLFFHYPFGYEYDVNIPLEYEEEFPNLTGGKPVTGKAKVSIAYVNFDDHICTLQEEVTVNPEEAKVMVSQFLKKMGFDKKASQKVFDSAYVDIRDNNSYVYYYNPGVPHKISALRTIMVNLNEEHINKNEESLMIELIYDDEK